MKRSIFILCLALLVPGELFAAGRLNLEVRYPEGPSGGRVDRGTANVEVVLSNNGDMPISIPRSQFPDLTSEGLLRVNALEVSSSRGVVAGYKGFDIHYVSDEISFETLVPKQSVVVRIDIAKNYSVRLGQAYEVRMRPVQYLARSHDELHQANSATLEALMLKSEASPSIPLWIDPRSANISVVPAEEEEEESECEDWQVAAFEDVLDASISKTEEALRHLDGLISAEMKTNPIRFEFEFNASPRYTKWFGIDMVANPEQWTSDDRYLAATMMALPERLSSPQVELTCHCKDAQDRLPTVMAYVRRPHHYKINTCPRFWASPAIPTYKDQPSQIGTLVHEASHFEGDYVDAGTGHHAEHYDNAQNLAGSNRSLAVRNANQYKFFVLDQDW